MPEVAEQTDRAHYLADLERVPELPGPDWLSAIREGAAREFGELDFPTRKDEAWRSTDIRPILRTAWHSLPDAPTPAVALDDIASHILDPAWPRMVLVDGNYAEELSSTAGLPPGARLESLADAGEDDVLVFENLHRHVPCTTAFVALNGAFLTDGVLVHLPKNTEAGSPVQIIHVSTAADGVAHYPRTLVVLGDCAKLELVETYVGLDDGASYLNNAVTELVLGPGARLSRYKVLREGAAGHHIETCQAVLERDASLTTHTVTLTGAINRNELRVVLGGENGEVSLNGLYLGDGDRVIDNALNVEHAASHCRSRMAYKGILDGSSTGAFTGKVYVHKDAQRTDSDQLNNNLLLSEDAEIDTRPQLEIFADDVKCTHGATVGGFPDEVLFYFRSRGISAESARGMLTSGFAQEVVDMIGLDELREMLTAYVSEHYRAG